MTMAFLYKWTQLSSQKWYIGSRTRRNCHVNDGYICSSKIVKPLICENPLDWRREILCIGNPEYIVALEARILSVLDAKHDPMSFNLHNGDGLFTFSGAKHSVKTKEKLKSKVVSSETRKKLASKQLGVKLSETTKQKMSLARTGKKRGPMSEETKKKLSIINSGPRKPHSVETRQKMSESRRKRPPISEETKQKISNSMKKKFSKTSSEMSNLQITGETHVGCN